MVISISHFVRTHARSIFTAIVAAFCVGVCALLVLLFVVERKYTSEVQILVIQKYTLTDSYTAAKSAEKVSKNLGEVLRTSVFLNDILQTGRVNLSDIMSLPEEEKRKEWAKKIGTEVDSNAPLLRITVYDTDRSRAEALATTIADVLIEKGGEYHGAPDTISLKIVDTALTSETAESPSIPLYTGAAVLATLCVFMMYYVLKETGSWLEPVAVVPTQMVHIHPTPAQPTISHSPAPMAPAPTHAQEAVKQDLNISNFAQKLGAQPTEEKAAYLHGDVQTMPQKK